MCASNFLISPLFNFMKIVSRRTVRFKTMQLLYAHRQNNAVADSTWQSNIVKSVGQPYWLLLYQLHLVVQVALYSTEDKQRRLAKRMPSEEDKIFEPVAAQNPIVQAIAHYKPFLDLLKKERLSALPNRDIVVRIYQEWLKTPIYKHYFLAKEHTSAEHKEVLRVLLLEVMAHDELCLEHLEEHFTNFFDDHDASVFTLRDVIQYFDIQKPEKSIPLPDVEEHREMLRFAQELFEQTVRHDDELNDLISPALQQWESERVTVMDLLLMKMALCEFLYFPSIPVKVTINEYIEVSKRYSSAKSKDFINGVLDTVRKELQSKGLIKKAGRGMLNT